MPRCSFVLLAALLLPGAQALAQAVPTPGTVREPLRPRPTLPTTPGAPLTTAAPAPTEVIPPGGRAVTVQRFEIAGNRAIPTEKLQAVVAPYEGRPLTLLEIYDVADLLTRYYRTRGYTLATATVPAQKVADGVITLEVMEGRLGAIKIEGNRHYKPGFFAWQLNELAAGEPVRDAPLERELLLLNDQPGLAARAVITPGADFGTSDLVVQVDDRLVDGGLRFNNYGRESIGEWRVEGDAGLNSLLGYGDRLEFNGVYAEADLLHYGRLAYSVPVTAYGTRVGVYYASYDYEVDSKKLGAALSALDIDGEGDNFGVNVLHPFWRSRTKNLYFGVAFDRTVTDQIESTFGTRTKSHLSLGIFNALFDYAAPDGSYTAMAWALSTNFNRQKRDPRTLAPENNAQTAKLQLDLSHYRALWRQLAMFVRFAGAASPDPLVDLEQFRIGGPAGVRAYPSSELAGDQGFMVNAELHHPVTFLPGWHSTILKAFVDTGTVYRKNHNLIGVEHAESLTGAGLGLQTLINRDYAADMSIAYPLGAHDASDKDDGPRFWVGLSANF